MVFRVSLHRPSVHIICRLCNRSPQVCSHKLRKMSVVAEYSSTRLSKLGERLRQLRESYSDRRGIRFTQRDAAKVAQVNEATYRGYEYGRSQIPEEAARRLAAEYGVEWREIYALQDADVSAPKLPVPNILVPIPYVGNVGANSKADWLNPVETGEYVEVPPEMATPSGPTSLRFACTIVGDSCYDLLWPGDVAVFHKSEVPRIGQVMLFRSNDNLVTVKQIKHNGREFILHPLNPAYDDVPAIGCVVGYLVGIVREQGSRRVTVYDSHGITP